MHESLVIGALSVDLDTWGKIVNEARGCRSDSGMIERRLWTGIKVYVYIVVDRIH